MKKGTKIILTYLILVIILVSVFYSYYYFTNPYLKEERRIEKFCKGLELEDYWWDCSRVINKTIIDNGELIRESYEIICEFDGKSEGMTSHPFFDYRREVSCDIGFLFDKLNIEMMRVWHCSEESIEKAFNLCKEKLPEEIEGIKIIKPKELDEVKK